MTVPLPPADMEKLHALHALAADPDRTFPHQLVFRDALYEHAGGLLAAARERDALRTELEVHKGAANKLRSDLAAEVRRLRAELIDANALLEDCARQFVASDYDGKLHHSCMWTDQALCRHLVKIGSLVREGEDHFRWVEQKPTMPTGQGKTS